MTKFLFFISIAFLIVSSNSVNALDKTQINDAIWTKLGADTSLTFSEVTKSGTFAGCEVVYRYVYRDFRSRNGEPVILTGSISSPYTKGKAFGLFLKATPHVVDLSGKEARIKNIPISFATLLIGKTNLDNYKATKFVCDDGGYCAAYTSADVPKFMNIVFSEIPFDPEIILTLSPDGMDSKFRLSEIKQNGKQPNSVMDKYTMCMMKIIDSHVKDMEKK